MPFEVLHNIKTLQGELTILVVSIEESQKRFSLLLIEGRAIILLHDHCHHLVSLLGLSGDADVVAALSLRVCVLKKWFAASA